MSRFASLLLLSISIAACAAPTEIVLVVDTDLSPAEVGTFWIRANGRCVTAPGDTQLPLTLGITPDGEVSGVDVLVAALEPGADASLCPSGDELDAVIVSQRARASFVAGERRVLFVTLERACEGLVCASGDQTCRAGACASSSVPTTSWTGVLPRLGDAVDGGMDAGVRDGGPEDAAVDGGVVDSGPVDSGPVDSGPPDSGPPDSGPDSGPPCTTSVLSATIAHDGVLLNEMGCTDCGGGASHGADALINIGVGVGLFQFALPAGVTPADFTSGVVRAVRLTLTRSTGCDGCERTAMVDARAARNDWDEGTGANRSGANWCRRLAYPSGACPSSVLWQGQGASGPADISDIGVSVPATSGVDTLVIDVPPDSFVGFATSAGLTIRVAPVVLGGGAIFVAASREDVTRARQPALTVEVCR